MDDIKNNEYIENIYDENTIVKNSAYAKKKSICVFNNALFLAASILLSVALFSGVASSDGKITVYNFYVYFVNLFRNEWSSVTVGTDMLADCGLAIAYIVIVIRFLIIIIKSIDNFAKICKNGYNQILESGMKTNAATQLKMYVVLSVCSALFYVQSVDIYGGMAMLASLIVLIISDYFRTFYTTPKGVNKTLLLYNSIKKATVVAVYAILYFYILQIAGVSGFIVGATTIGDITGDSAYVASYAILLIVYPMINVIIQFCFMSAFIRSMDYFLNEEDNFIALTVMTAVACAAVILANMLVNFNDTENIFDYIFTTAGAQTYPFMLSLAGMLVYIAYKSAVEDERLKEIEEKKRIVEIKKAETTAVEEQKKIELKKSEEEARRAEATKQIAEAIIKAQKEDKANKDAEEMSQIIAAALKKLYDEDRSRDRIESEAETAASDDDDKN